MQDQFLINGSHRIIKNHRAYDRALLPGLAYIDMLYQFFREHGHDYRRLELRNLSIYNPLSAGKDFEVLLNIRCSEEKDGQWQIRVEGQEQRNGAPVGEKKLYITAEMLRIDTVVFAETLDPDSLQKLTKKSVNINDAYEQCRRRELVHSGFMKAEGTIYYGEDAIFMDISIAEPARPFAEHFMFHPTLIDGSAVGSGGLFNPDVQGEPQLYLPLFYESFRAANLFREHCITRIKTSSLQRKKELVSLDMEFFNEAGQKIGELRNFINKLVRDPQSINPQQKKPPSPTAVKKTRSTRQNLQKPVTDDPGTDNPATQVSFPEVESFLKQLLARRLKKPVSQIESHLGYYEMGLDSPGLLEIIRAAAEKIGVNLSPTLMFEYTTIAELAAYLADTYPESLGQAPAVSQGPMPEAIAAGSMSVSVEAMPTVSPEQAADEIPGKIAIIGMAGRYPGARNIREFWNNLREGKDCITEIPESRWDWQRLEGIRSPSGKNMSKWGGFIDDPDCFDSQFFRISPREAETIDPQERLFLQTCWEAMEDAGYTPKTVVSPRGPHKRRHVGVFVGVMHKDYTLIEAEALALGQAFPISLNYALIANRVSYYCNFHGPSLAVDTVCSSSLIAVHLALESIARGESEVALAGGVNLSLHPYKYMTYGMMDMHASDSCCHTFGKGGDGYVSGEGIGAVLLKPLHKALRDHDHIYAVINGSTINHGGTVSGVTVPSPVAQADLIRACLEKTGIHPRTISFVEAHGTGTSLGDPIEIQGLAKAYRHFTQETQYCSIGSVKSNIGHGESAAGISGLSKVALQLYHKTLVPSLHSEELNPYIDFKQSPFYVQQKTEEWRQPVIREEHGEVTYPRRAGLSSFGAYGSNAHVILEEFIPEHHITNENQQHTAAAHIHNTGATIIPLSARTSEQLHTYVAKLLEFLESSSFRSLPGQKEDEEEEKKTGTRENLETRLGRILANIIHVNEAVVEAEQEWIEYGVEPVHLTQFRERIQEELMMEVEVRELGQQGSIAAVTEYLMIQHREREIPIDSEIHLADLAYTLQVGREPMEERVIFMVREIPELVQKLRTFLENKSPMDIEHCYRGGGRQNKDTITLFTSDPDSKELIYKWMTRGRIKELAELWVRGLDLEWELFYNDSKPRRIGLPTYPFSRERYWVPGGEQLSKPGSPAVIPATAGALHPLVQQNTSDLTEQRFSSTFTGREFFLADHRVKGRRVLPGVVYLEMARAAVLLAAGNTGDNQTAVRLKNVVWIQPVVVGEEPVRVHIGVFPGDNFPVEGGAGEIDFEIYSHSGDNGTEPVLHSQGCAVLQPAVPSPDAPPLDLKELQAQCSRKRLSGDQCREMFREMGLDYGPAHQGIETVWMGQDHILAKLSLPACVADTLEQYILPPGLLDPALQACLLLMRPAGESHKPNSLHPPLPFTLQELEILNGCTSFMWALVRRVPGSSPGHNPSLDIDMCDETGRICVRMKGFSTRVPQGDMQTGWNREADHGETPAPADPLVGTVMLVPVWDSMPGETGKSVTETMPASTGRVVVVGGNYKQQKLIGRHFLKTGVLEIQPGDTIAEIEKKIESHGSIDHIFWIAPGNSLKSAADIKIINEQARGVLKLFRMIKALLNSGWGARELGWTILTTHTLSTHTRPPEENQPANPTHAGIHGLAGTMAREFPNWKVRLVDLDDRGDLPLAEILALPPHPRGNVRVYRDRQWYQQQLIPLHRDTPAKNMYRCEGVYVVIGGAGGIGEAWSEYVIRTYKAQIIWIGRRSEDEEIRAKINRLAGLGPSPLYLAADASNPRALQTAYEKIKQQYTQVHGVIHAAIVLSDQSLVNMEEETFKAGLSAKVDVSVSIARVFKKEALDFVLFFSSIISFTRTPGQSNYAAGSTFKDAFAHRLSREWPCTVKVMNWGYWGSIGIVAAEAYRQRMARSGIGSIEPAEAMEALETLLAAPMTQTVMMKTLSPSGLEGMNANAGEYIRVYPETFPALVREINDAVQHSKPDSQNKSTGNRPWQEMEELLYRLLWGQLQSLKMFTETSTAMAEIKTKSGLRDLYGRWFTQSTALLARKNYLHVDGEHYRVQNSAPVDLHALWEKWDEQKGAWLQDPGKKAWVALLETVLRALPEIITGKRPATEVMFPNSSLQLVEGIYKNNPAADYVNDVLADTAAAYIEERLHRDSSTEVRILEVGAGTGATSARVMQKLQPFRQQIQEYCYTDISRAFLLHAQEEYGAEYPYLTYQIFNLEAPIGGQGIGAGSYDIVIAANVLHATRLIRQTLRNIKAVLRKNGLLLIIEPGENSLFTHLTFGLLEGWWLFEDPDLRLPGGPALSPQVWQQVLESEGFHSVLFPAQPVDDLGLFTAAGESDGLVRQKQALFPEMAAENKIKKRSAPQKHRTVQVQLQVQESKSSQAGAAVHLTGLTLEDHVRTVIRESTADVLKMEEGQIQDDRSFSDYGVDSIIAVHLVNLINQQCRITLQTTVLFDYNNVEQLGRHILSQHGATLEALLQENLPGTGETGSQSRESTLTELPPPAVQEEQTPTGARPVYSPRRIRQRNRFQLPEPADLQEEEERNQEPETVENQPAYQRVIIRQPGGIDDLRVIKSRIPELKEKEVRIAIHAFSLNFGDLLCVKGLYPTMPPYPFTPGFEAGGMVLDAGSGVKSVQPGDAVVVFTGEALGGQATMITCPEEQVFPKPGGLSFAEACALPGVAITMIAAFRKAQLKKGQRILIQTAAGGTGLIAVQLAQYHGAEIYATAGSQAKLDYLKKLGVPHRINYRQSDFEKEIKKLTAGKGVDVVINTLPGDAIQKGMNCLSAGGRYIEIAMTALKSAKIIDLSVLSNNQTFYSFDLRKLGFEAPKTVNAYRDEMIGLVEKGIIRPTIHRVFPWEQVKEAYRCLEERENIGKIVVAIPEALRLSESAAKERSTAERKQYLTPHSLHSPHSQGSSPREPIAVIGISGRFAGSKTVNDLWEHLAGGHDLIEEVTRWDLSRYYPDSSPGKNYCNYGSFLEDIDRFDPLFFNISGVEATYMDPQQRFFLEECWKALEDAGYAGTAVEGRQCGVYVGCGAGDYHRLFTDTPPAQAFWGNAGSVVPARISYYLNLQGPAVAVDTACSSSLVALHLACQALWAGEIEMALAGGVFLQCTPGFYLMANQAGMLSLTGHCYTFDQRADGFVPGEGVGAAVLKPLNRAVTDNDHIYGIISGSGINQDGATNGITAPSAKSQERLQCHVYETFNIDPQQIQMVEAHGTGTKLGDPIEFEALTRAFGKYTDKKEYCAIGSIKTNLGHTATAAGMAGFFKVLLSLTHKQIPPSLHFQTGNANIRFKESPFYVNTALKDWDIGSNWSRCAAISSFGFSGTNAHMVIEEAPALEPQHPAKPGYLIVLSARSAGQLQQQVQQLLRCCDEQPGLDCGNMSYTLLLGRKHLSYRLACVAGSVPELTGIFKKWLEKGSHLQLHTGKTDEKNHRQQPALKRYGNECIRNCRRTGNDTAQVGEYLERLAAIADLYVRGYTLEFEELFSDGVYCRISLPAYPFARERCWVPRPGYDSSWSFTAGQDLAGKTAKDNRLLPPPAAEEGIDPVDELMIIPQWEEQPRMIPGKNHLPRTVLVVYHESGAELAKTILEVYRQNKTTTQVLGIGLGNQTKKVSETGWTCDTSDAGGFATCLQGFDSLDCLYFIAGGYGIGNQGKKPALHPDSLVQRQQDNEIQLLRLVKFLKQGDLIGKHLDCYIISRDNLQITDTTETPVNAWGGGITGLAYALAQGDHRFAVRNIDISSQDLATPQKRAALPELIMAEEPSERGEAVKIKSGRRYKQVFLKLAGPGYRQLPAPALKKEGVYVILGGSGTVGEVITRNLLQEYNARVIWMGRKPESSPIIEEKRAALREYGEPPLYIQADATSLEQMKDALATIKRHVTSINGAIFSGLVFKFENSIDQTTESEFLDILNVKTLGSLIFYHVFKDEALDFMCYFSSGQAFSFSGAAQLSAYATGITFSDTFVRFINSRSEFPVGTINWGFWKSSAAAADLSKNSGVLEDQEGYDCFKRFTGFLQAGILNQVICLRASQPVLELMKVKPGELILFNEKSPALDANPDISSLGNNNRLEPGKVEDLAERSEPEEFRMWMSWLLFLQMRRMGLFVEKGAVEEKRVLLEKAGIINKYERWFDECLAILESRGFVKIGESGEFGELEFGDRQINGIKVKVLEDRGLGDGTSAWKEWESIKTSYRENPDMKAQVKLVDACLKNLPEILRGNIPATDILFPDSSMDRVEGIYKHNARSDLFNTAAADFIAQYVENRLQNHLHNQGDSPGKIRLIEIGAGTGGTSALVFDRLKSVARHIEFCYTDISRSFLMFARENYDKENPYLQYRLWNVEKPLAEQDIEVGGYDLALASNVLHATKNIRQTLRNAKAALKANGILLLNEITSKRMFATLTFGLLDGWWFFEDEPLRIPGSPLLNPASWQRVLEEEGFSEVHFPTAWAGRLGQQIIAAKSNGMVRQEIKKVKEVKKVKIEKDVKESATPPLPVPALYPVSTATAETNTDGANLENYVKSLLLEHLSTSLQVLRQSIESHAAFSDYGVDSIIGVKFVKQVSDSLGVTINSAILFDYTTVDDLTGYIVNTYREQLQQHPALSSSAPRRPSQQEVKQADDNRFVEDLHERFFAGDISTESLIEAITDKYLRGHSHGK